jgi:putative FmdB family regulatory protein
MPIYEYECTKCGHQTEILQKFSDKPVTKCDVCHGSMKRLISHSTFHLKGTGWYVTDYASKSGGNKTSATKTETTAPSETKTNSSTSEKKSPSESVKKKDN